MGRFHRFRVRLLIPFLKNFLIGHFDAGKHLCDRDQQILRLAFLFYLVRGLVFFEICAQIRFDRFHARFKILLFKDGVIHFGLLIGAGKFLPQFLVAHVNGIRDDRPKLTDKLGLAQIFFEIFDGEIVCREKILVPIDPDKLALILEIRIRFNGAADLIRRDVYAESLGGYSTSLEVIISFSTC